MIAPSTCLASTSARSSWLRARDRGAAAAVCGAALVCTAAGLSGVGDAPAPNHAAASMAAHFEASRSTILAAAPFGLLGGLAIAVAVFLLGRRLQRESQPAAGAAVAIGGCGVASYLTLLHVVYATLAYPSGGLGADATKALFVLTILAAPAFGLAVTLTLAGAAVGARRARLLPTWWTLVTGLGAVTSAVAIFSYDESGYFSPDVQQQIVGNIVLLWLLATTVALTTTEGTTRDARGHGRISP